MLLQDIELRKQPLVHELLNIWERSVRASHFFLTETDIQRISVQAEDALWQIPVLVTAENEEGNPVAFMGVQEDSLEILFVSPEAMGRGAGKLLLQYGIERHGVRQLCVNEQNPVAKAFYEHMGFRVAGRMECDEQGNPFPLLKMELNFDTD